MGEDEKWTGRRLVVDWDYYAPVGYVLGSSASGVDPVVCSRVLLVGPAGGPDLPGVVVEAKDEVAQVAVLSGPEPDVVTDLGSEDESGLPWVFVDEARDPDVLVPGAVIRAGSGPRVRAWVEVVDRVKASAGELVHLRPLPVVVTDDSLPPHPFGFAASTSYRSNAHPRGQFKVGDLVVERDMIDPPGTEMPARVSRVEADPDRFGHVQLRLLPVHTGPNAHGVVYALFLSERMGGRWLVRTRYTNHIWDLDAGMYTRVTGPESSLMDLDDTPVRFTKVALWPEVGGRSFVYFDDPVESWLEHWRASSRIRSITALTPGEVESSEAGPV